MKYKLAISNIAWTKEEDAEVYPIIKETGFTGLEIAPSRIWEDPYEQSDSNLSEFKNELEKNNIRIVAFQSLLFGHPEFAIFGDKDNRSATMEYLKKNITLAGKLGAKALIFGSPKNRIVGTMAKEEADSIAMSFFQEIGECAVQNNTCFCIEPNPRIYGGDFILTTNKAIELVKSVNHPGFKLNIDLGTITANNENLEKTIREALPFAGHFHISEPYLEVIERDEEKHKKIKSLLNKYSYTSTLSIEMKSNNTGDSNIENVRKTLVFISNIYNG
jgi:sugar phosphate isomerase/epimerase